MLSYNVIEIHSNDNSFRSTARKINFDKESNLEVNKEMTNNSENNIDSKFCIECMIDIPLRAKHCGTCNKCITTFDHHCFWVGNCIGEKNKRKFILFLLVHSVEIGLTIIIVKLWIIFRLF
jgi:palmitoyltransferase